MHRVPNPEPVWRLERAPVLARRTVLAVAAYGAAGFTLARAQAPAAGRCVLTPESGEGPFYFDPALVRSDLSDGQPGAPLDIDIEIVRAGDCATLENARVDIWSADALGLYSGYERQSGVGGVSTRLVADKSYLRGTQVTDASGSVRFRTIYPSWYGGRTPHLHFKIFVGGGQVVASQVFFPDEINDGVFGTWEPYRQHVANRRTRNADDMFLTDGIGGVFCSADVADDGVRAAVTIAVQPG